VAVCTHHQKDTIELLSLVNGRVVATLRTGRIGEHAAVPADVRFSRGALYAISGSPGNIAPYPRTGWWPMTTGLTVAKFDLTQTGRADPVWRNELRPAEGVNSFVPTFGVTANHVLLASHEAHSGGQCHVWLLQADTGKTRQAIRVNDGNDSSVSAQHAGRACVSDTNICVDMPTGLGVYQAE
jgi:hypothetical protein